MRKFAVAGAVPLLGLSAVLLLGLSAILTMRLTSNQSALPPCQPAAARDAVACSTVDGFPVGPSAVACGSAPDQCRLAVAGLAAREPGHSPIVRVRSYGIDLARLCGPTVCTVSGVYGIWVFDLADGGRRAIGVRCPGIGSCEVVPRYTGATV